MKIMVSKYHTGSNMDDKTSLQEDFAEGAEAERSINRLDDESASQLDNDKEIEPKINVKCSNFLIAVGLMIQMYCVPFYTYVTTQYFYHRIQTDKFPGFSSNGSHSKCENANETESMKKIMEDIQKEATHLTLIATLAISIPSIFAGIIVVSISDKYGRKYPFIVVLTGTFLKTLLTVIGIHFNLNVYIFIAFIVVDGMFGSWCSALALGFAYVADLTRPGTKRTRSIIMTNVCIGIGLVLSGVSSGYIIKGFGFLFASVFASGLCGLNVLLNVAFLPESLQKARVKKEQGLKSTIFNSFVFYIKDTSVEGKRWKYRICVLVVMLQISMFIGRGGLDPLYQLDRPFCWGPVKIGWYSSLSFFAQNIIGQSTIRIFQLWLRDEYTGIISSLSSATGVLVEAFAYNDVMLFVVPVIGIFGALADGVTRSIMSNMTPADKQGAMFAGIALGQSVMAVIAEVVTKSLYAATVGYFRGLTYLVLSGICVISALLLMSLVLGSRKNEVKCTDDHVQRNI